MKAKKAPLYRTALVIQPKPLAPRKHYASTLERYAHIRPLLEPLVRAGQSAYRIAAKLEELGVLTPRGRSTWGYPQVMNTLQVCGLHDLYMETGGRGKTPSASPQAAPSRRK